MQGRLILDAIDAAATGQLPAARPWPWLAWMAVCLCRHQAKQEWAFERKPHLAHGGLDPGWSYAVDTQVNVVSLWGPDGERIRLPLYGGPPLQLECAIFREELLQFENLPMPEARLVHWLPDRSFYGPAMAQLAELRLLRPAGHGASCYAPGPELQELAAPILDADFTRPEVLSHWMEALGERESTVKHTYHEWLMGLAPGRRALTGTKIMSGAGTPSGMKIVSNDGAPSGSQPWGALRLPGPRDMEPELFEALCRCLPRQAGRRLARPAIDGPVSPLTVAALATFANFPGNLVPAIARLGEHLDPRLHDPEAAWLTANILFRQPPRRPIALALVDRFSQSPDAPGWRGNPYDDRWTVFMLELLPHRALAQVRRGLRSVEPECARNVAALLALLDRPWCHAELEHALETLPSESQDRGLRYEVGNSRQRFLAQALTTSKNPEVRARGEALHPRAALVPGPDRLYRAFQEASIQRLDAMFETSLQEMAALADWLDEILPRRPDWSPG